MCVRREAVLSAQIEGTQASLADVLDEESGVEESRPDDVWDVINYVRALKSGLECLAEQGRTTSLLCAIHATLLEESRGEDKSPGMLRTRQNWISRAGDRGKREVEDAVFVPPPASMVRPLLDNLCAYASAPSLEPLLARCAIVHAQFETIHPFLYGNGRLGRLLTALMLCHHGALARSRPLLYRSAFLATHKEAYYEHLQGVRERGRWEEWTEFFLEGVRVVARDAVERSRRLIELQARHCVLVAAQVRRPTASRLLSLIARRPRVTVEVIVRELGVSPATANTLVGEFVAIGLLRETTGCLRARIFLYHEYFKALTEDIPTPENRPLWRLTLGIGGRCGMIFSRRWCGPRGGWRVRCCDEQGSRCEALGHARGSARVVVRARARGLGCAGALALGCASTFAGEFVALGTLPNGALPNVIAISNGGVLASGSPGWVRRRGEGWVALPTLGLPGTATDIAGDGANAFAARSSFENTLYILNPGQSTWTPLAETRPRTGAGPLLNQGGTRLLQSIATPTGDVLLTAWENGARSDVRIDGILADTGSGLAWLAQEDRPVNSLARAFVMRPDGEFIIVPRPVPPVPADYNFFAIGMSGSGRFVVGEYEELSVPAIPRQAFVWEFGPGGGVSTLRPSWSTPLDVADDGTVLLSGGAFQRVQLPTLIPATTEDLLESRSITIPPGWSNLAARFLSDDARAIAGVGTFEFAPGQTRTESWIAYPCGTVDFASDGVFPDVLDVIAFFEVFGGGACPVGWCESIDFNNDGVVPDIADVISFLSVFTGGPCEP